MQLKAHATTIGTLLTVRWGRDVSSCGCRPGRALWTERTAVAGDIDSLQAD